MNFVLIYSLFIELSYMANKTLFFHVWMRQNTSKTISLDVLLQNMSRIEIMFQVLPIYKVYHDLKLTNDMILIRLFMSMTFRE